MEKLTSPTADPRVHERLRRGARRRGARFLGLADESVGGRPNDREREQAGARAAAEALLPSTRRSDETGRHVDVVA